jgi:hypothetical protein
MERPKKWSLNMSNGSDNQQGSAEPFGRRLNGGSSAGKFISSLGHSESLARPSLTYRIPCHRDRLALSSSTSPSSPVAARAAGGGGIGGGGIGGWRGGCGRGGCGRGGCGRGGCGGRGAKEGFDAGQAGLQLAVQRVEALLSGWG